jgi:hypothetical protein
MLDPGRPSVRNLADQGGEEAHTLTVAELAGHGHAVTDPGHTHAAPALTVNDPGHTHAAPPATVTDPGHTHPAPALTVTDWGHVHPAPAGHSAVIASGNDILLAYGNNVGISEIATGGGAQTGIAVSSGAVPNAKTLIGVNNGEVPVNTSGLQVSSSTVPGAAAGVSVQATGGGAGHNTLGPFAVGFWIIKT